MKLLTLFEAIIVVAANGEVCCYKGVCPTAERCNACIRGLTSGLLSRKARHLCSKFWSSRCGDERKSASCHAFGNQVLVNSIPQQERFDCIKVDAEGNNNFNCRISPNGDDCICEENDHLSGHLDENLDGLHYPMAEFERACDDLEELSRTTRVKLPPRLSLYCDKSEQLDWMW